MKIYGLIYFESPLIFARETLGNSFDIVIAGQNGLIILPDLPVWEKNEKDPLHKPLVGPSEAEEWKRGDKPIVWGEPISFPDGYSDVKKALFIFDIKSKQKAEICSNIYNEFNDWMKLFDQYITLLTTQNSYKSLEVSEQHGRLELIEKSSEGIFNIKKDSIIHAKLTLPSKDVSIHNNDFKKAVELASSKQVPRLEYRMLLEAYKARRKMDNRKAIVEGASALEVCLTEKIMNEFKKQKINFGNKLIQKFRMLGGKFELIRLLDVGLPDKDYDKLILNPRNEVMHKASFPDAKTTNLLITEVENLLKLFSPELSENVN